MLLSVEQGPGQMEVLNSHLSGGLLLDSEELAQSPCPSVPPFTDVSVVPEHDEQRGFELTISDLQGEMSALRSKQRYLDSKRREALNKILDIKGSIRVFCRVRSPLPMGKGRTPSPLSTGSEKITVTSSGGRKEYCVDKVFPQGSTQEDVFVEVEPILRSALDGHNVCVFAYGQTGTGKTFTMEGTTEKPGIVPRAIKGLFLQAAQEKSASSSFTFSMSMLEVYLGSLRDLLAQRVPTNRVPSFAAKSNLSIQAGSNGSVEVEGLTDVPIDDFKQAYRWYARGKRARSTSWTNVNEASSRSHCLTRITIGQSSNGEGGNKVLSKLWMVDLGGSERLLKTGATGQTMDEGKAINLSLSSLGDVIAALKRRRHHVPYRNSKLTQILSDSLGDGSKVLMLVHISPSEDDAGETVCSLNFAKRARASEFTKELSDDLKNHREELIAEFSQQIKETEEELNRIRSQMQITEHVIYEKKRLLEDQKGSPRSPLIIDCGDLSESPRSAEKPSSKTQSSSVPRFMTSTVCSRQRQGASGELMGRVKTLRSGTRSSFDLLASQSRSFSDPHSKPSPQTMKTKLLKCQSNKPRELSCLSVNVSCHSVDSRSLLPRNNGKMSSTSHPSLRVSHRRRMSDLI